MPHQLFTLTEMACIICERDNRPNDFDTVWATIRGLSQRNLLKSSDNRAPRGAARFDEVQFARAAILLELRELGIGGDNLARVDNDMRVENRHVFPTGATVKTGLEAAVVSLFYSDPHDYFLVVKVLRTSDGRRVLGAEIAPKHLLKFGPNDVFVQNLQWEIGNEDWSSTVGVLHSTVVIPLTALLRPLLVPASA